MMKMYKAVTANNIAFTPYPFNRELAMEAYLIENESILALDDEDFEAVTVLGDEIHLKGGGRNKDGRIDIFASYGAEYLSIIELKKGEINEKSLEQLERYLAKKEQLEIIKNNYWDSKNEVSEAPKWLGVLVGTSISEELRTKLKDDYLYNEEIPIAAIVLDRYRDPNSNIFVLSEIFFKDNRKGKDYTKYKFNGEVHGKGQLVLAIVKQYIEDNPEITYAELEEKVFPKELSKYKGKKGNLIGNDYGVFTSYEEAQNKSLTKKRYFLKPNQIIHLKESKCNIAVSSQWGIKNIDNIIDKAKDLGYEIIPHS